MKKLEIQEYKPQPLNKRSEKPMLYRLDIIGWDKNEPLVVSELELEKVTNAIQNNSFVRIGDNLINPTSIRFIKAVREDKRSIPYKKIRKEDGSLEVIRLEE